MSTRTGVRIIEKRIGVSLPDRYLAWLNRVDKAMLERSDIRFRGEGGRADKVAFLELFPLCSGARSHLTSVEQQAVQLEEYLPRGVIPIGSGMSQNSNASLVLYVSGKRRGQVWVKNWEHDRPGERRTAHMNKLANSFDEFMDKLYEPKDDELA